MNFFAGDIHNLDKNIIMYEHRPFANETEMRLKIIQRWNKKVASEDTVYLLGDIGDPEILAKLSGQIVIILGNHDNEKDIREVGTKNISYISKYPIMVGNLWLSHEPIGFVPPECPYLNIHAHTHRFVYGMPDRTWEGGNRYFCASMEQIDYTPISEMEIAQRIEYHAV